MAVKDTLIKRLLVQEAPDQYVIVDLPASYVFTNGGGTLQAHVVDTGIHLTEAEKAPLSGTNAANGLLVLTGDNKIPLEYIGGETGGIRADVLFATIAERNAASTATYPRGFTCFVTDATGDPTVTEGWAIYRWDTESWTKIYEGESIDASVWDGSWDTIIGKPLSSAEDIDAMVNASANAGRFVTLTSDPAADIDGYA